MKFTDCLIFLAVLIFHSCQNSDPTLSQFVEAQWEQQLVHKSKDNDCKKFLKFDKTSEEVCLSTICTDVKSNSNWEGTFTFYKKNLITTFSRDEYSFSDTLKLVYMDEKVALFLRSENNNDYIVFTKVD